MAWNFHEDLKKPAEVHGSSDRHFGLVFASAFAILGLWPLLKGGDVRTIALGIAAGFLAVAVVGPRLRPLNKAWTMLGLQLGRIMNPAVTAVMFFLVFTPAGWISRLLGRDPLRLKPAPDADTYWISRQPPGPAPETMSKQF